MTGELVQPRGFGGTVSVSLRAPSIDDSSIALSDTAAVFKSWSSAALSLAVWRREPHADIGRHLDELRLDQITGWRRSFDAAMAGPVIAEAMTDSGFCQPALEHFLAADMALLIRTFATSTGTSQIEARLDIIRDDACRLFHVDRYPARLAVTYIGPGTVWVPHCHGEQALIEQTDYAGPTLEIPSFSAGLFAGEQTGRFGLVHRSPSIAGTGRMRLFFCVNATSPNYSPQRGSSSLKAGHPRRQAVRA